MGGRSVHSVGGKLWEAMHRLVRSRAGSSQEGFSGRARHEQELAGADPEHCQCTPVSQLQSVAGRCLRDEEGLELEWGWEAVWEPFNNFKYG